MGQRLEDRASAARCPIQPTWTFAILCRSYGAAPRFGYGSYKDFAPTELRPSCAVLAANMYGPFPVGAKLQSSSVRSDIFIAHGCKRMGASSVRTDIFVADGRERMGAAPVGATYL